MAVALPIPVDFTALKEEEKALTFVNAPVPLPTVTPIALNSDVEAQKKHIWMLVNSAQRPIQIPVQAPNSNGAPRIVTMQPLQAPMPSPPRGRPPPKPRKDGSTRKERKRYFDAPRICENCRFPFTLISQYSGHLGNCTPETPWDGCPSRARSRALPGSISCGPHQRKRKRSSDEDEESDDGTRRQLPTREAKRARRAVEDGQQTMLAQVDAAIKGDATAHTKKRFMHQLKQETASFMDLIMDVSRHDDDDDDDDYSSNDNVEESDSTGNRGAQEWFPTSPVRTTRTPLDEFTDEAIQCKTTLSAIGTQQLGKIQASIEAAACLDVATRTLRYADIVDELVAIVRGASQQLQYVSGLMTQLVPTGSAGCDTGSKGGDAQQQQQQQQHPAIVSDTIAPPRGETTLMPDYGAIEYEFGTDTHGFMMTPHHYDYTQQ